MNTFDFIVVGAGAAGCLLANRQSAHPQHRVLLIEAGGRDNYPWVHIPVGYLYCIGNPRTDWLYQTEADAGLNGRRLRYPRGKVLGGCSSINGMIYMRGQARDYDQWARLTGDDDWSWARYRPEESRPGPQYQNDDELARLAGDIATTIFHPVGTTAMGRDGDPMAVTDPRLRVRDGRGGRIAGLRVVDAGIMPTITSGNTNSPTLMVAEKAARWILAGQ